MRLAAVVRVIGAGHWEPTRSAAADEYVHKDDTAVEGTRFELGGKSIRRNSATDWEVVRAAATSGDLSTVPADVLSF